MFEFIYRDLEDHETVIATTVESENLMDVVDKLHTFLLHVYSYVADVTVTSDNGKEFSSNG